MEGDTSDYDSHSEADMALCSLLAFYTQDENQLDRLFRLSGLYRKKWDRDDYRKGIFEKLLRGGTEVYGPPIDKPTEYKEEPFVPQKPLEISLVDVMKVIRKWLYIEDDTSLDVMLGTYVANKLPGDPIWIIFIGDRQATPRLNCSEQWMDILKSIFYRTTLRQLWLV